jgi:hypothetical protein
METPATASTNPSTGNRGIQSLVGHKKWRILAPPSAAHSAPEGASMANITPQHSSQQDSSRVKGTRVMADSKVQLPEEVMEPTQPTPAHELVAPIHHAQVVFTRMTPPPSPSWLAAKPPQAPARDDENMDIVPDSEPLRSDLPPSEKLHSRPQQAPLQPVVEDDEIIPDSIEEEVPEPQSPIRNEEDDDEEEEDQPRRISGRVKRRAVYTEESSSDSDVPLATTKRLVQSVVSPRP